MINELDDQQMNLVIHVNRTLWLTGASNGPVRVRTRSERVLKILWAPDREPDRWSGSSSALNLGPDHGPVQQGSGSNHGSELNLTIPKESTRRIKGRRVQYLGLGQIVAEEALLD